VNGKNLLLTAAVALAVVVAHEKVKTSGAIRTSH
jgi:hypothetical protein